MMDGKIYDEPSSVGSDKGEVIVDGPDGVAVSLTPEAAQETGDRLIDGAVEAAAYRRRNEKHEQGSSSEAARPGDH